MPSGWARIKDAVLPFCNDLFERNRLRSGHPLGLKHGAHWCVGSGPGGQGCMRLGLGPRASPSTAGCGRFELASTKRQRWPAARTKSDRRVAGKFSQGKSYVI